MYPRVPPQQDTPPRTGMTNYPRDEFDRVPEFSNRSGSHRANGWAAAAANGVRPGLRWLMVFGVVALLVGTFSFTALPKLMGNGDGTTPAPVAANSTGTTAPDSTGPTDEGSPAPSETPGESSDPSESGDPSASVDPSETPTDPSESTRNSVKRSTSRFPLASSMVRRRPALPAPHAAPCRVLGSPT